ncbi:hypothetical protein, partial [Streptomyces sp. NPDC003077]|uniref:hypothetical protein n=1 Tax=Streptomyces sp. NPDC003077 TaxID=3154443 RepID=UPI0033BE9AB9
ALGLGPGALAPPAPALAQAAGCPLVPGSGGPSPLESPEFDPCALQARPPDLLRRRQHGRAVVAAGAAAIVAAALLGMPGDGWGPDGPAAPPYAQNPAARAALDPARLTRAAVGAWQNAPRRDFSVWPARGDRVEDRALLRRALAVWARPGRSVQVAVTPGTAAGPPAGPPQLLYAGVVDRATVVLLYDGLRVARYAETAEDPGEAGGAALDLARVDGADTADAGALVLNRADENVRYLTAPWAQDIRTVDLLKPGAKGAALHVGADGATAPSPTPRLAPVPAKAGNPSGRGPAPGADCTAWPALRMDGRLLTDLGELTPARLTYGAPAKPGEVRGKDAETAWARTACHLRAMRGVGVRTVNTWQFARQSLPGHAGEARWTCTRADTWRGAGSRTLAQLQAPARNGQRYAPGAVVAHSENGPACGPRDPRALTGVMWRAPNGQWWMLAAGSDQVSEITASGGVRGRARGQILAVRATPGSRAHLNARTASGEPLSVLR